MADTAKDRHPPKIKMPATLVPDWYKMSKQITEIGQYLRFVAGGKSLTNDQEPVSEIFSHKIRDTEAYFREKFGNYSGGNFHVLTENFKFQRNGGTNSLGFR